ncbi:hypothetical protein PRZ48_003404 [Zasmidium cellare]|uniref:CENP-V/GFA domain-containing protein n=1 Tax=Zasmidium cellare TaxID=395010 RepID=A0ABR0EUZ1_ZASCE|nr:hypothetical protein PRZ48_003404 [Zasmidium cellare]
MAEDRSPSAPEVHFRGSCACGRITYACSTPPKEGHTTACHCVTCRKISGGPFQAFAHVAAANLTFFDNQEHSRVEGLPKDDANGIVFRRLSPIGERAFCGSCSTSLAMRYKHQPQNVGVTLGTIDEDSVANPKVKDLLQIDQHIFMGQSVSWLHIDNDGVPKYARFTSGEFEEDMAAWVGHNEGRT